MEAADKLPLEALTLPEFVRRHGDQERRFTYFGKWHLGDDSNGGQENPNLQGFDHFEGNPRQHHTYKYFDYDWFVNGERFGRQRTYKTTFIVDRFLRDFQQNQNSRAHFSVVSFVSPHIPFHLPPNNLHSFDLLNPVTFRPVQGQAPGEGEFQQFKPSPHVRPYYDAMLQALDNEIDRLVRSATELSDRPVLFVFFGDNGSAREVFPAEDPVPYRAKSTVYEGGARIPLMVWSDDGELPLREGGRVQRLVHITDLFPTLAGLMGVPDAALQSISSQLDGHPIDLERPAASTLLREFAYIERGNERSQPFALAAIDQAGWKLILREAERPVAFGSGGTEFYETPHDPFELENRYPDICETKDREALERLLWYILAQRGEQNVEQILGRPNIREEVLGAIEAERCPGSQQ
jgi:arylsulfatase A-like enzyme